MPDDPSAPFADECHAAFGPLPADVPTKSLFVRQVPLSLHRALRMRAALNGRTIEGEHLAILEAALAVPNAAPAAANGREGGADA